MYDNICPAPVGPQIRRLRKERGLSLSELASLAATSAPALHRYESGWDRFEIRTLKKIATALGAGLEIRLLARPQRADRTPTARELVRLLAPLFWDKELLASDLAEYPSWVLGRVLQYGQLAQVRAARRFFGDTAIEDAIEGRGIDARTRSYWHLMLAEPCTPRS